MSIRFSYDEDSRLLTVDDNGKFDSIRLKSDNYQSDRILGSIVKSLAELSPIPGPSEGISVTLKPAVATGKYGLQFITPASVTTDGTFIDLVEGDVYTVEYGGVIYNNQVVRSISVLENDNPSTYLCLGNLDSTFLRSGLGYCISEEQRVQLVDSEVPFAILQIEGNSNIAAVFMDSSTSQSITVRDPQSSDSYTLTFTSSDLTLLTTMTYIPTLTYESLVEELNISNGNKLKVILDEEGETEGTWVATEDEEIILVLEGYTEDDYYDAPIYVYINPDSYGDMCLGFMNDSANDQVISATFIKE